MELTRKAATLASVFPIGPLELPVVDLVPRNPLSSAIAAQLIQPAATSFVLTRMPPRLQTNLPLDIELRTFGVDAGSFAAALVARLISSYAHVTLMLKETSGQSDRGTITRVSVRRVDSGWIMRALIHPASWTDVASVSVESFSFAGQPLPSICLPATLRVGYNHVAARAGAVISASMAGDVAALQSALDAGGSTEEADQVGGGLQWWVTWLHPWLT